MWIKYFLYAHIPHAETHTVFKCLRGLHYIKYFDICFFLGVYNKIGNTDSDRHVGIQQTLPTSLNCGGTVKCLSHNTAQGLLRWGTNIGYKTEENSPVSSDTMSSRLTMLGSQKFLAHQTKANRTTPTWLGKLQRKMAETRQEIIKKGNSDNTLIKIQMNITGMDFQMTTLTQWLHRELSDELIFSKGEYKARKTSCAMWGVHTVSERLEQRKNHRCF